MSAPSARVVDVVVPVVDDVQSALASVRAALASRNATRSEVFVVAANADVARAVATAAQNDARLRVVTARAATGTALVAHAVAMHADRDVVLIHAGAEVHGDWLDRLAAYADEPVVGVVDALSGSFDAAPDVSQPSERAIATAHAFDALHARVNRGNSVSTSVVTGACLYVKRACLDAIGANAGAGTDMRAWCDNLVRRAREQGFDTRIAGDVFVHGVTAGDAAAGDTADALRLYRGRVDLAVLAASPKPAIVFVSHAWHGGIRRYMDDLAALIAHRVDVLYLVPADADTVKLYRPRGGDAAALWFRLPADLTLLAQTLQAAGVVRLHVHHVHGLPRAMLDLPEAARLPYDCTLHDYYPICAQYHLADADGRFCGEPGAGCRACLAGRPAQWGLDIDAWRATLGAFVRGAARVIAPSHDVAARVRRHLPGLEIDVWPHPEAVPTAVRAVARVVTLGALSREKGLAVVAACARDARARDLPLTFRVLGPTAEPLPRWPEASLTVYGSYEEAALPELLAAERADVLFFPAQVPETYAYTLTAALATQTPIVAPALGAFVERLEGRPNVRLLRWDASPQQWNAALVDVTSPRTPERTDPAALTDAMRAV